jgi:hypothetical protein
LDSLSLKTGALTSSETSVNNYQSRQRHVPEGPESSASPAVSTSHVSVVHCVIANTCRPIKMRLTKGLYTSLLLRLLSDALLIQLSELKALTSHLRLIHTCHAAPMPCRVNSHTACRAPAILRQCRVLRESPCGSRK